MYDAIPSMLFKRRWWSEPSSRERPKAITTGSALANAIREELWRESKNRLKALVHEAVNVLSTGLYSSDPKIAITSAVHILKTVGLYGEVKDGFGPTTPERAVWDRRAEKELQIYMALRPDSFCGWSVKNSMKNLAHEDVHKHMKLWYEMAVDEQERELREFKKRQKAQKVKVELVPLKVEPAEEALSQGQGNGPEPIKI